MKYIYYKKIEDKKERKIVSPEFISDKKKEIKQNIVLNRLENIVVVEDDFTEDFSNETINHKIEILSTRKTNSLLKTKHAKIDSTSGMIEKILTVPKNKSWTKSEFVELFTIEEMSDILNPENKINSLEKTDEEKESLSKRMSVIKLYIDVIPKFSYNDSKTKEIFSILKEIKILDNSRIDSILDK